MEEWKGEGWKDSSSSKSGVCRRAWGADCLPNIRKPTRFPLLKLKRAYKWWGMLTEPLAQRLHRKRLERTARHKAFNSVRIHVLRIHAVAEILE